MDRPFKLVSKFKPTGDQPEAIQALYDGLKRGDRRLIAEPKECGIMFCKKHKGNTT